MSDFTFWVMVVIVGDPATIVFFLTCRKIPESRLTHNRVQISPTELSRSPE